MIEDREGVPPRVQPGIRQHRKVAIRRLEYIRAATDPRELAAVPGNRLEALRGNRAGQHSIRINEQWRICFRWKEEDAFDVEIVDYH